MDKMYSFNEIGLIPAVSSSVSSRSQVNPFIEEGIHQGKLPIFVSPMTSIIDDDSFKVFNKSKVIPIHPRSSSSITPDDEWRAYSLADFEKYFVNPDTRVTPWLYPFKALIDVANGHMDYIYELVSKAKEYYKSNLIVMIGNIANPETYKKCIEVGVDYIRVGIGGGCFIPGQKVILANGEEKNIEDIQVGDIVKTHTGENHKVEETYCYNRDEILYDINGIKCTANHEFYVINISDEEKVTEENLLEFAYWLPADKLDINLHRLIEL